MGLPNINTKLLKGMGIDKSQVDTTKVSTSKPREINTKTEKLKDDARQGISKVNEANGENVTFLCLQRDGKTKDGKPKYKPVTMKGNWVIEKGKDGLFFASRVHYYTETYKIADFTIIGSNSDSNHLEKQLTEKK